MLTSTPRETRPPRGALTCTSTMCGCVTDLSSCGTSDSREGRYDSVAAPRMPAPTKGVSSSTPSRHGTPAGALSMNKRYAGSSASTASSRGHGTAPLPLAKTRGRSMRCATAPTRCRTSSSETTRMTRSFRFPAPHLQDQGPQHVMSLVRTLGDLCLRSKCRACPTIESRGRQRSRAQGTRRTS